MLHVNGKKVESCKTIDILSKLMRNTHKLSLVETLDTTNKPAKVNM